MELLEKGGGIFLENKSISFLEIKNWFQWNDVYWIMFGMDSERRMISFFYSTKGKYMASWNNNGGNIWKVENDKGGI